MRITKILCAVAILVALAAVPALPASAVSAGGYTATYLGSELVGSITVVGQAETPFTVSMARPDNSWEMIAIGETGRTGSGSVWVHTPWAPQYLVEIHPQSGPPIFMVIDPDKDGWIWE